MAIDKKTAIMIAGAIVLVAGTAAIASYSTRQSLEADKAQVQAQPKHQKMAAVQQQPVKPNCDDKNIVGTVAGGVAGGVVGNQIGKGSGKTAATVGGVVGGAVLGNQFIPTRNVTCPQ